jgi:uncharacterized membrane protein YkoI
MKKSIILPVACLLIYSCKEKEKDIQASDLPSQVTSTFNSKYPNATEVKWEEEMEDGKKVYEADFKVDGKKMEVEIDTTGTLVKEEQDSATKATH